MGNWAKRQGVQNIAEYSDSIMGIFDIDLDDIIIPLVVSGGSYQFFAPGTEITDYHPFGEVDPGGSYVLYAIEMRMRAINERLIWAGIAPHTFSPARFDSSGNYYDSAGTHAYSNGTWAAATGAACPNGDPANPIATILANTYRTSLGAVAVDVPVTGFYKYDLAYMDAYNNQPWGTYATSLVQEIYDAVKELCAAELYILNISGKTTIQKYDAAYYTSQIESNEPTVATYKQSLTFITGQIQKFYRFENPTVAAYDWHGKASQITYTDYQKAGDAQLDTNLTATADAKDTIYTKEYAGGYVLVTTDDYGTFLPKSTFNYTFISDTSNTLGLAWSYCKLQCDLTDYVKAANCEIYMKLTAQADGAGSVGNNPFAVDNTYHLLTGESAVTAALYQGTTEYGNDAQPPSATEANPTDTHLYGWTSVADLIVYPTFTYPI